MRRFSELVEKIKSDLYRYTGDCSMKSFWKTYFFIPGFQYSCKMRVTKYCREGRISRIFFPLAYWRYRAATYKYGIEIPYKTQIGYGFYIGHFGGIVVHEKTVIGNNVNISQGVTLGQNGIKEGGRAPVIRDSVYIGTNSTVIGGCILNKEAAVGANALVNADVPKHAAVGGIPAKVISENGSEGYIQNVWPVDQYRS